MQNPGFQFLRGACGQPEDLQKILTVAPAFDIIIDDASHASYHQQNSFKVLFPSLRPGGLYIIEDLHWQSPFFEESLPYVPKTWQFLTDYFLNDKYCENQLLSCEFMGEAKKQIHSFAYFRDFTGQITSPKLIVIRKGGTPIWQVRDRNPTKNVGISVTLDAQPANGEVFPVATP